MRKAIDTWLVNHNFNPVFDKSLARKNPQDRKEKVNSVNEDIHASVEMFEAAIEQMVGISDHINGDIEEARQDISAHEDEIEFYKQEIQEEQKLISKLENRKEKTKRIRKNLEQVISPALEDEDEDEFIER